MLADRQTYELSSQYFAVRSYAEVEVIIMKIMKATKANVNVSLQLTAKRRCEFLDNNRVVCSRRWHAVCVNVSRSCWATTSAQKASHVQQCTTTRAG